MPSRFCLRFRMFYLRAPSDDRILALLDGLRDAELTYAPQGSTREDLSHAPTGFVLDRYGVELGRGRAVFDRARAALSRIENYPPSFTRIVRRPTKLEPGGQFATVVSHMGFCSVHPCRILYVIDEPARFGFGFGTLPGHAECGEERFLVSLEDETVRYDVQAFSRPHAPLARLGAPVTRAYQRRFQRETVQVMRRASAA